MNSSDKQLPSATTLKGLCTRCGHLSQFRILQAHNLSTIQSSGGIFEYESAAILQCMGCDSSMIVVSNNSMHLGTQQSTTGEPFFYYPTPGSGVLNKAVPTAISSCYDEGQKCLSVGAYRAAVVMFRAALAEFVQENGSEKAKGERDLYNRLKVMAEEGDLHPSLVEWAKLIREGGNEGAHTEKYDPVTKEKALGVATLTKNLIFLHYEVPAMVAESSGGIKMPDAEEVDES